MFLFCGTDYLEILQYTGRKILDTDAADNSRTAQLIGSSFRRSLADSGGYRYRRHILSSVNFCFIITWRRPNIGMRLSPDEKSYGTREKNICLGMEKLI